MARERHHPGDFGGHLRQARERKGVSLRHISDITRISYPALEALERNDISKLPGGIFSRAIVRSYATQVGIDPETTVEAFVTSFPDDSVTVGHRVTVHLDDLNRPERARRIAFLMKAAMIAIPVIAVAAYVAVAGLPGRRSLPPTTQAVVMPRATHLTIAMTAKAACTLSYAVDGQAEVEVTLPAASQRVVEAHERVVLRVSDATALDIVINGAPAKPLGPAGSPASVIVTLDNVGSLVTMP